MRSTFSAALLALLGTGTSALAAGGAHPEGLSWLVILFLVFGGLVIVFQMIPGLILFGSMIRGLFTSSAKKTVTAALEEESKP